MKLSSAILFSFKNLRRRKLRTVLTTFAILIGTTLISSMVSLGVGLQQIVVKGLKDTGELTDINVYQKEDGNRLLDSETISKLESLPDVARVDPMVTLMADEVSLSGFEKNVGKTLVTAVPSGATDVFKLIAGSPASSLAGESAVIGENFLKEFSSDYPERFLGKSLNLTFGQKNLVLKIVGVARGENILGYGVFIPLTQASEIKKMVTYDSLRVKANSVQKVAGISKEIKGMGLEAVALDDLVDRVTKYFRILELALGSVGIIILGVASLGIINTMIMATLERTREIGVMRAVGASRRDILKIFSLEASAIGFIGGFFGVLCGWGITLILSSLLNNYIAAQNIVQTQVDLFALPWWLIGSIIVFATLVGLLSGLYPAFRASRMDPVEALRGE
ncbi:MAG: ABC transporter permease [Patescibacteria group bacterium]|nr:ABC transporter permease [Patescibacteria group bacterium]